jgi:hypothetical protein
MSPRAGSMMVFSESSMAGKPEVQYQQEASDMLEQMRDIFAGHQHGQVLYAIALYLEEDCLEPEYFMDDISIDKRIDNLLGALKALVLALTKES